MAVLQRGWLRRHGAGQTVPVPLQSSQRQSALIFALDHLEGDQFDALELLKAVMQSPQGMPPVLKVLFTHPMTAGRLADALWGDGSEEAKQAIIKSVIQRGSPSVVDYLVAELNIRASAPLPDAPLQFGKPFSREMAECLHRNQLALPPIALTQICAKNKEVLRYYLDVVQLEPSGFSNGLSGVMCSALGQGALDVVEELCARGVPIDRPASGDVGLPRWGVQHYLSNATNGETTWSVKDALQLLVRYGGSVSYVDEATGRGAAFDVLRPFVARRAFSFGFGFQPVPASDVGANRITAAMDYLIECGVRFDTKDNAGVFPLAEVLSESGPPVIAVAKAMIERKLLPADCATWRHPTSGHGLLHLALRHGDEELVRAVVAVIGVEAARNSRTVPSVDAFGVATEITTLAFSMSTTKEIVRYLIEELALPAGVGELQQLLARCSTLEAPPAISQYLSERIALLRTTSTSAVPSPAQNWKF